MSIMIGNDGQGNIYTNIETSTQKRKRKAPPSVQRALDANKGKSKASITKGIYKRLAKDRGIEYPKRRGSAKIF